MSHNGLRRVHPYLRAGHFHDPANQFWEIGNAHTEKSKEYFRNRLVEQSKESERKNK